ncbi:unnamed protein product, partial [Thelazia callipaeda]|uniref:Amiloride-sensitive sodium channel n=1 Tax=Thelazia callipaeda TaxID=103827 RepID=A0A0N5D5F6_THECL
KTRSLITIGSVHGSNRSATPPFVDSTEEINDEPLLLAIIENANMDGVKHLHTKDPRSKYFWAAVILIFVLLACFQSFKQVKMYITTPIATNIEAAYPNQIPFPVVAVCNNNQFRLTYLTGPAIQNRKPKEPRSNDSLFKHDNITVFDKVLLNAWDMDAVKFLRNAAHWKSRMILSCTWPNGTSCRLSNFKAVWTLTGLCWAINVDPNNPHYISSSGSNNGLRLLLNIERYERVQSCTPYFRTTSLPGLKILIYNQSDIPESSLHGVNVPPGYTMEIPFRMQKRHKYSGAGCVEEKDKNLAKMLTVDDPQNIHSCSIRKYLRKIEKNCKCSMARAYNPNPGAFTFCNVEQYFTCVLPTLQFGKERGFDRFDCPSLCDEVDYTAWQDMTLLPNNIFPSLIDTTEEEDVEDVIDDYDTENELNFMDSHRDEHFQCQENQLLSDQQIRQIKRAAQRAYEKQSRYQEDIQLRTKRLILKLQEATQKLIENGWGWTDNTYRNAFERLNTSISCFIKMPVNHAEMFSAIENPSVLTEESRISLIHGLLASDDDPLSIQRFQTMVQLREVYGERVDEVMKELQKFSNTIHKLYKIYDPSNYKLSLGTDLKRMNTTLALAQQYEAGRLQRRVWAEKMQSRNMRHFFDQEFYENWYNPMLKDLDEQLVRNIADIADDELPKLMASIDDGKGLQIGSILYFGDTKTKHKEQFAKFVHDIVDCTFGNVKNESIVLLTAFKKAMNEFQSAYTNLYHKELPTYLANFDFGSEFVEQNFAMVNVFLHRMTIETWRQESTYSIWSLACDVGGALGLFLGASLLTVIELCYSCIQYGLCNPLCYWSLNFGRDTKRRTVNKWRQKKNFEQESKLASVVVKGIESKVLPNNTSSSIAIEERTASYKLFDDNYDDDYYNENHLQQQKNEQNIMCMSEESYEHEPSSSSTSSFHFINANNNYLKRKSCNNNSNSTNTKRLNNATTSDLAKISYKHPESSGNTKKLSALFRSEEERQTFV